MRTMEEILDAAEDYARNYRCPDELRRPIFLQHLTWLVNQQLACDSHDTPRRRSEP